MHAQSLKRMSERSKTHTHTHTYARPYTRTDTRKKFRKYAHVAILHTWGEKPPETVQVVAVAMKSSPERERFSVPHAARDPQVLQDRNLDNEDIFKLIKNPPAIGVFRIFEEPESWDTSSGPVQAVTTQGIATVNLPSGPLCMDGAQWHLLKKTPPSLLLIAIRLDARRRREKSEIDEC